MLTRLKVNGFKNLVDVDVRFGPFTCIAGVNGSGKSNLFDAIRFLAALAEKPLVEATDSIRGEGSEGDNRGLFHRMGNQSTSHMSFEVEMVVPHSGIDDLGQLAEATYTFLRYSLEFSLRSEPFLYALTRRWNPQNPARLPTTVDSFELVKEELVSISVKDRSQNLSFPYDSKWSRSAIHGRRGDRLIWTDTGPDGEKVIRLKYERFPELSTFDSVATQQPRTVLSTVHANLNGTAVLAQQEMRSWRVLQLDPSAMREPDRFTSTAHIGPDGAHLAATLYNIAHAPSANGHDPDHTEAAVYARVRNRLLRLIRDVREVTVERDDKREEFTLYVTDRNGTRHSARALSDGTLRMLALAVLEEEQRPGVLCIEEPENGIHPGRIPALLDLLQAIAMDTRYPIEEGNPLRQVIISTHSPSVVMQVPGDSLVVAELRDTVRDGKHFNRASFSGLANTWRDPNPTRSSLALGTLLTYLNPEGYRPLPEPDPERVSDAEPRVMDRPDVRRMLSPRPPT